MSESRRFCENCGNEVGETTNFCPSCGAAQRPNPNVPTGPPPQTPRPGSITTPGVGVPPPPPQTGAGGFPWKGVAVGCSIALVAVVVLPVAILLLSRLL